MEANRPDAVKAEPRRELRIGGLHWRIPSIRQAGPAFFFRLNILYLIVLVVGAAAYSRDLWNMSSGFLSDPVAGLIPIGVPVAGALGGVMISMYGVFQYSGRWSPDFNYWHAARPIMGAILGSVGFLMFLMMMNATGVNPPLSTGGSSGDDVAVTTTIPEDGPDSQDDEPVAVAPTEDPEKGRSEDLVVYYVLAFVIGYREETFRELIKRVLDIIFRPGGGIASRATLTATPKSGPTPLRVLFDATSSTGVARWKLDFGDGAEVLTGDGPPGSFTHLYETPGHHVASLTVTGDGGDAAATSVELVVGEVDEEEEVVGKDHGDDPIPDEDALTDDRLPAASGRVAPQ